MEWDKKFGSEEPGKRFFFDAKEAETERLILIGSNNTDGEGYDDLWLVNLDGEGNITRQVKHGNQYFNFVRSVVYTRDRGYAITGGTQNSFEEQITMWVLKLNDEGKF